MLIQMCLGETTMATTTCLPSDIFMVFGGGSNNALHVALTSRQEETTLKRVLVASTLVDQTESS